jgi:hypothetical protein
LFGFALFAFYAGPLACAQDVALAVGPDAIGNGTEAVAAVHPIPRAKAPVESEVVLEGLASYGNMKPFGTATDARFYTAGIEYDRHTWGRFLGAQLDYTAEVLPVVLLLEAKSSTDWGAPTTLARQVLPGIAIAPIGFRLMWRESKTWKPYFLAKGGMLGFTQKALSQHATYENFYVQSGFGFQVRMTERVDARLGLFSYCHFSNAFLVPVNPGLDLMSSTIGVSYHLGERGPRASR